MEQHNTTGRSPLSGERSALYPAGGNASVEADEGPEHSDNVNLGGIVELSDGQLRWIEV